MRLIDADALMADVRKNSESYFADDFAHEWVDRQPTIDAVPVVRCRECKYAEDAFYAVDGTKMICCANSVNSPWENVAHEYDWFCADSERKDGAEDDRP